MQTAVNFDRDFVSRSKRGAVIYIGPRAPPRLPSDAAAPCESVGRIVIEMGGGAKGSFNLTSSPELRTGNATKQA